MTDISQDRDRADGIKFAEYSSSALAKGIRKALALYAEPELLRHYRLNGMTAEFSWEKTARKYLEAYERILTSHEVKILK